MLRTSRFLAVVAIAMIAVLGAVPAFAAPVAWESVDVTYHSDQTPMLLVSGQLPQSATLPAEAQLAVPAGYQVQWVGEILGGEPSADPELTYTTSTVDGMDVYSFTMTKARIAQVEVIAPTATTSDGSGFTTALNWKAWTDLKEVRISQRVPAGTQITTADEGATLQPGDSQFSYYTKTVAEPKAGDTVDLAFAYTAGAVPAASGGTGSAAAGGSSIAPMLLVALAVAGFGLLFYNVNRKMAAKSAAAREVAEQESKASAKSRANTPSESHTTDVVEDDEADAEPAPRKPIKPLVPAVIIIGVVVVAGLLVGYQGTTAKVAQDKITKAYGGASPCTNTSIPVMARSGVDLAAQGEQIVDAFVGMDGIGDVTLDLTASRMDITFCESEQTDETLRAALLKTGLVELGAAPVASAPASATLDADGTKQAATIDTSAGTFSPNRVALKAGVPAELSFGAAASCVTEVIFSELGIEQDLKAGPATVKLPALEPGTYTFACAMGHQTGELVVE